MALWMRTSSHPETWAEMEAAARERFWDGLALACEKQRETGAVYLWGYVAEMLLECASLRARGVLGSESIATILKDEGIKHHRLEDLKLDLQTVRSAVFRPIEPQLNRELETHVDTLANNWDVLLRYRSTRATESELDEVHVAVEWFVINYSRLA